MKKVSDFWELICIYVYISIYHNPKKLKFWKFRENFAILDQQIKKDSMKRINKFRTFLIQKSHDLSISSAVHARCYPAQRVGPIGPTIPKLCRNFNSYMRAMEEISILRSDYNTFLLQHWMWWKLQMDLF